METRPKFLYRGIKIDYDSLQDFKFTGVDLIVNYAPVIDKYGRKTVTDGNEYGVYMSDNLQMVLSAYGELHHDGKLISNLKINYESISLPLIAIVYKINAEGLDIRRPFITSNLRGHYNNGYSGDEWIADVVPADKYTIYRVKIGDDILHKAEEIDVSNIENIDEFLKQKLELRKSRLVTFANAMEKLSPRERNSIGDSKMEILKSIYGEHGLMYIDENDLDTTKAEGMLKFLLIKTVKEDQTSIDFQTIEYIYSLKEQVTNVDSIIERLNSDRLKNKQKKEAFVERQKKAGSSYSTSLFDSKDKKLEFLSSMVLLRKRKDEESKRSHDTDSFSNSSATYLQEWEKIKKIYDYDNLSSRMQTYLEQEFLKEMFKKKISTEELQEWEKVKKMYDYDNLSSRTQDYLEKEFHKLISKRKKNAVDFDDTVDKIGQDDEIEFTEESINKKTSM